MTAIELKTALLNEIRDIEDETLMEETLKAVRRAKARFLRTQEEETIGKEEILAGIAEGLREVRQRVDSGEKGQTLEEFINEL